MSERDSRDVLEIDRLRFELSQAHRIMCALVAAAGGRVAIGHDLLVRDYVLQREEDLATFSTVFRVREAPPPSMGVE